jgi:predicted lipoprotein
VDHTLSRRLFVLSLASSAALALAGCKIVPIGDKAETEVKSFDAKAYADGLWTQKALPHFTSTAKSLPEVLAAIAADLNAAGTKYGYRAAAEGSPWSFIVSGTGTVSKKNTESRAGTLIVALDGATPPAEITIQIGPVVKGNSVRDSLPFVSFKDFTNQLEFADAGKAMTALAMAGVAADVAAIKEGDKVSFTGAMSLNTKADKIIVTPVALKVGG